MSECRICGVTNTIIAENAALQIENDEMKIRIDDLEQELTGDVAQPEQIEFFRPYKRRVNLQPPSIQLSKTKE